jgi:hypothetical protein
VLVDMERLLRRTRIPKQRWLWWSDPVTPDFDFLWRAHARRLDMEHTYRFCRQALNRTTARPRLRAGQRLDLPGAAGLHRAPL